MEDVTKTSHSPALHAARLTLVVAASFAAADARDAHTTMSVSATVLAVADIDVHSAPSVLSISAADLRRGFIDVSEPTRLTVRSNSQSGYELELRPAPDLVSSLVVRGLDRDSSLGAEGGKIAQHWQGQHVANLELTYQLRLAPGVSAGDYPWPVRLAVTPLEGP